MRLLCFSDAQLGAGTAYGREPGERLQDQHRTLMAINAAATNEQANLILFCGDAFQHRRPSAAELNVWRQFLEYAPCPVLAIAGNHDTTGPGQPTSLDVFVGQPGYSLATEPYVAEPTSVAGDEVACLPWAHPSYMRATSLEQATPAEVAERLVQVAAGLRARCGSRAVLALHWAMSECSLPGGLPTSALSEPVLPLEDLRAQGWAAIVAGHIHKAQRAGHNVVVCGSPYVCDFGEADLPHGYWLVDTNSRAAPVFHELPGRPFVTIDLDLTDPHVWAKPPIPYEVGANSGAVVRVRYTASEAQAREVDQAKLKRDLYAAGAHKVYAIEATVVRSERPRVAEAHEHLEPLAALDLWLAGYSDEHGIHRAVAEAGARLIEEVR